MIAGIFSLGLNWGNWGMNQLPNRWKGRSA